MYRPAWPLAALLMLGACGGGAEEDAQESGSAPEDSDTGVTIQFPAPEGGETPPPEDISVAMEIPPELRGRWGMNAADCEPGRSDAKGLLAITPRRLEFYESVGDLVDIDEIDDNRIRATFAFSGEGMTWEQDVSLDAQDGGTVLVRREYGADAAPGPFRYTKCG